MEEQLKPKERASQADSNESAQAHAALAISPLPLEAANKSEHVPPIIIKGGSFFLDCEDALGPPMGGASPPFTHRYPYPFPMRGIRVIASPFGAPETLYYHFDPTGCRIDLVLRGAMANYNLSIASVLSGMTRVLELTTRDHMLPTKTTGPDPDRRNRYAYASDDSIQLSNVSIISPAGQVLFQTDRVLPPGYFIGIWRAH